MTGKTKRGSFLVLLAAGGAAFMLFPAAAVATPAPVPAPAIPGAAGLPGPLAAPAEPAEEMGILKAKPDTGPAGSTFVLSGTELPAGKDVSIVWTTSNVNWILDARPTASTTSVSGRTRASPSSSARPRPTRTGRSACG